MIGSFYEMATSIWLTIKSLTNEERNALKGWDGAIQQHDPGQMTQQQLLGVANTLSDTGKLIALVNKRVVAEMETLADGLKAADL